MKEVTESYIAANVESNVRRYWDDHNIYRKTRTLRNSGQSWFFVDGPPYTTGHIHLGTAWNKILKDSILRYHSMTGKNITERAGYDMHGLPIEVKVEEKFGFKNKADIEKHGVAEFIEECREFALTHKDLMSEQFKNLGIWMNFDDPYQTIDSDYIEAAWYTLKRCEEEKMLERGSRVVNWCPRCGTAIADAEVEYWNEVDPSIFVKFRIVDQENEYFVIWTTTPWTLPANVAVAVGKDFVYAKIQIVKDNIIEYFWIAEDLAEQILRYGKYQDYSIVERKTGMELTGTQYVPPLIEQVPIQKQIEHRVVIADYVTMENTGIVHIAPGHGWDDYLVGLRENLPIVCPVDENGNFTEEAGIFVGLHVKDEETNNKIIEALGHTVFAKRKITHRYGHCWRCKTSIIYRATSQWFLKAKGIRNKMLAEISDEVTWYPDWAGSARFHDWIGEARDWCISRQRYWGIPMPIWICSACDRYHVIGRYTELEELSGQKMVDPHRPYVDNITIPCECGDIMKRVPDIFDVWYDSGVASWATLRFPQQTATFEKNWPVDFILEGQDQTRGWFYSQLALSTIVFGKSPYKSVLMHGFALDANGKKMSKSLGNVIVPEEVISQFGVDALRQYILSTSAPWDDLRFSMEGVKTTHRMLNVLWNVYRFPLPYMQLDEYTPAATSTDIWDPLVIEDHLTEYEREDRWLISRVNSLATQVTKEMEVCNLHRATRQVAKFILNELSRWYVQLVRPRMWLEEDSISKKRAYDTMYYVLRRMLVILAPFAPHITEEIYLNLRLSGDLESVHMQNWFSGAPQLIDSALEEMMEIVQEFDEAVANARQNGRRKGRWPVGEIVVATKSPVIANAICTMNDMCCDRANAHSVKTVTDTWNRVEWVALPMMKVIGKQFGHDGLKVKTFIEESSGSVLKAALARDSRIVMEKDGFTAELTGEHMMFEERMPKNVFSSPLREGSMVYVDITLTPELESEGYAREIIRRIQEMRKQANLSMDTKISCEVMIMDEHITQLLCRMHDLIAGEVRASDLVISAPQHCGVIDDPLLSTEWNIDGLRVSISIAQFN